MKILLASSNEHKRHEIQQMFLDHEILLPKDLGLSFDCAEDDPTFLGNALQKAFALYEVAKDMNIPVMADDSGLIVDALPGRLGVKTARFGAEDGGPLLPQEERNALLLKMLEGKPDSERSAAFVCAMVIVYNRNRIYCAVESTSGRILQQPTGEGGFGYDPLFFCNEANSPMALLSEEGKNSVSHRGKAVRSLLKLIND